MIKHGKTGLLVKPGDAADLAKKIAQFAAHPEQRAELTENAFALVQEKFSIDHVNEKTIGVYRRLVVDF